MVRRRTRKLLYHFPGAQTSSKSTTPNHRFTLNVFDCSRQTSTRKRAYGTPNSQMNTCTRRVDSSLSLSLSLLLPRSLSLSLSIVLNVKTARPERWKLHRRRKETTVGEVEVSPIVRDFWLRESWCIQVGWCSLGLER